jgi:twinkle protein
MGKADNMFKLYVQIGGGAYFCHRCGAKGSWYDFKMKLGGYEVTDTMGRSGTSDHMHGTHQQEQRNDNGNGNGKGRSQSSQTKGGSYNNNMRKGGYGNSSNSSSSNNTHSSTSASTSNQPLPMPSSRLQAAYITNLLDAKDSNQSSAMLYLTNERGLDKQTLRKYGVGLGSYNFPSNEVGQHNKYVREDCITFPWIMRDKDIAEQENLRGCDYNWKPTLPATPSKTVSATATTITAKVEKATAAQEESNNEAIESFDEIEMEQGSFVTRRIKARAIHQKSHQRLDPPGGGWGLFGWHTVPHDAKEIILTEGEYDAMAVHQATGRPAVSLPNGCRSLPVEVLPMLERFDTIILWMDNDGPGREGAEQFAKKIGVNRCLLVQPDSSIDGKTAPKDANEALLEGMDLENIIRGAEVLPHERILTFKELRTQVLHEMLNPEKYSGVPVPSLPGFTDIIKGFRRGELTVLTGPTGSGKSWNLCMHVSMSRHAH